MEFETGTSPECIFDLEASIQPQDVPSFTQQEVLKECESYLWRMIFVINGGSMFIDNVILLTVSLYLTEKFNASKSDVGLALFCSVFLSPVRLYGVPYLAAKSLRFFSYDKTTIARLLVSTFVILLMALTDSRIVFLMCTVFNSITSVSSETIFGVIALLLPNKEALVWQQPAVAVNSMTIIFASVFVALSTLVTSFTVMYLMLAATYFMLFVYALVYIRGTDQDLIAKQLQIFRTHEGVSSFFTVKVRKMLHNRGNKYRRNSSVAMSIFQQLTQEHQQQTGIEIATQSALNAQTATVYHCEFPIYFSEARKLLRARVVAGSQSTTVTLSIIEWTIVLCAWSVNISGMCAVFIGNGYFVLYITAMYPEGSTAVTSLTPGLAAISAVFSAVVFRKNLTVMQKFVMWSVQSQHDPFKANNKHQILAVSCVAMTCCIFPVWYSWVYVLQYYHLVWFVSSFFGYFVCGIPLIVASQLILLLKTEHLEAKLQGIGDTLANVFGAVSLLLVGIMWETVSMHSVFHAVCFCSILSSVSSAVAFCAASKLKVSTDAELTSDSDSDNTYYTVDSYASSGDNTCYTVCSYV